MSQQAEQVTHYQIPGKFVSQSMFVADLVNIAFAGPLPGYIAFFFQIGKNPMNCPFSDINGGGHFSHCALRIMREIQEHQPVVCDKGPVLLFLHE